MPGNQIVRRRRYRRKKVYKRKGAMVKYSKGGGYMSGAAAPRIPKMMVYAGNGFPRVFRTKLVYCGRHTAPAAVSDEQLYRGNSLFDPDFTGGGHQPMYFDQLTAVYKKYLVRASKIEVTALNTAASGNSLAYIFLLPNRSSSLLTGVYSGPAGLREAPRVKYKIIRTVDSNPVTQIKAYMSSRTVYGKTDFDHRDSAASVTTNPTQGWYWHIVTNTVDNATNLNIDYDVRITYYVDLYNLEQTAIS